jgi:putative endonuclease
LYSNVADKYYVGHTNDIERRLTEHNDPIGNNGKFCIKNRPWKLVYSESGFNDRASAMKREKQIKSWKNRKKIEELISSVGIPIDRD